MHLSILNIYSKLFTKTLTTIYCSICWLIGLLINLPNILGWSNFIYDKETLNCMWNRLASRSYSIFFPLSSIIIPCFIILYFYLSIFIYAVRSHSRANQRNGNLIYSLRVAKGLFVSYLLSISRYNTIIDKFILLISDNLLFLDASQSFTSKSCIIAL